MIVFDLTCPQGHIFEGWFDSNESFEEQNMKGLVRCPVCDDSDIRKVMSPVAVRKSQAVDPTREETIDYQRLAKEVVEYIKNNSEDVGAQFAAEALKSITAWLKNEVSAGRQRLMRKRPSRRKGLILSRSLSPCQTMTRQIKMKAPGVRRMASKLLSRQAAESPGTSACQPSAMAYDPASSFQYPVSSTRHPERSRHK